jgi:DNA-directed RNA polymerase subunit K/omega
MSNRDVWVNRCRQKIRSRFLLAQAAVLRWEQLLRGARARIPTENPKWMETPLKEIATDAVKMDAETYQVTLHGTPFEPPRPVPEEEYDELEDIAAEEAVKTVAKPSEDKETTRTGDAA